MSVVAKRLDGLRCHCMEVGFGLGDFVFNGDPATPTKKAEPPDAISGPCLFWLNGWMGQDATWYGGKRWPR